MNNLIHVTNRTMLMATIYYMREKRLSYKLKVYYSISYYRLPSSGPHPAVHFLWKRSISDNLDCAEQLKLIHELKNQSKHTILEQWKLKSEIKLGIVKPCQANFLIKGLLGDQSAASDDIQSNIFYESGEDIAL